MGGASKQTLLFFVTWLSRYYFLSGYLRKLNDVLFNMVVPVKTKKEICSNFNPALSKGGLSLTHLSFSLKEI